MKERKGEKEGRRMRLGRIKLNTLSNDLSVNPIEELAVVQKRADLRLTLLQSGF